MKRTRKASSSAAPQSQTEPTPKPLSASQRFTARLQAIMKGDTSDLKDRFVPLLPKSFAEKSVGELKSTIAHELYSFHQQLEEECRQVRTPRTPAEVSAYKHTTNILQSQAQKAKDLLDEFIFSEFPTDDPRVSYHLNKDWVVSEAAEEESSFGCPPSLMHYMLQRQAASGHHPTGA
ncbi:MAG: hypothetical protein V4481_04495 [Patescibacteria group bacterium]